jgi:hypothetical protein
MKIYVLVLVTYCHYRFQDNIYAHTEKEKITEFINNYKDSLPVFEYTEEPDELWCNETKHWWIDVFNCD